MSPLLSKSDPEPYFVHSAGASGPFLLVCDHAGRRIPEGLQNLGLIPDELERHIAWDIGAHDVTLALADTLGCTAVLQPYSRLVVDCNRDPARPDCVAERSDGTTIPGNVGLSAQERMARVEAIHAPYHAAIAREMARSPRLLVSVHSFTPAMGGQARPWHVGLLHAGEPESLRLMARLRREAGLTVGDNQPYALDGTDYTVPHHAQHKGRPFVELEIRQDLIGAPAGVAAMVELLARTLPAAL